MQTKNLFNSFLKLGYRRILGLSFMILIFLLVLIINSHSEYPESTASEYNPKLFKGTADYPKTVQSNIQLKTHPQFAVYRNKPNFVPVANLTGYSLHSKFENQDVSKKDEETFDYKVVEEKPKILKKVNPYYPEIARKAETQGTVVVKVLIDKKGLVEKAEILKSIPTLDEAALEAAKQYKFTPGKQRDKLVKVWMCIPFKFKLK